MNSVHDHVFKGFTYRLKAIYVPSHSISSYSAHTSDAILGEYEDFKTPYVCFKSEQGTPRKQVFYGHPNVTVY